MSLSSIIGQASRGADLYFVFRFLRLLTMDYKKTDAYKFKIIDFTILYFILKGHIFMCFF